MVNIARSPQRGSFSQKSYRKALTENPDNQAAQDMLDWHIDFRKSQILREETIEWQTDNLEHDLRTSIDLCLKVKTNEAFAQNLYAAMCNNEFVKNETWNILQDKRWSCSWRHAGGIIADMQEKGDYIDWYCSGIHNALAKEEYDNMSTEEQKRHDWMKENFVGEGYITDEVKDELFKLGWIVAPENNSNDY